MELQQALDPIIGYWPGEDAVHKIVALMQGERVDTVLRSGRFDHVKIKQARALIDSAQDLDLHTPITRRFYGGCIGQSGHYLWDIHGHTIYRQDKDIPWEGWDGPLQPKHTNAEGLAIIHYKREEGGPMWTAISFWDRTVDKRGNSSSNFFADSHLSFDEMLEDAKEHWPYIFERYPFEVVEMEP